MKKIFFLLLMFCATHGRAQLMSFYVTGVDTLWGRNPTTGATIQLNRFGAVLKVDTAAMLFNYLKKNEAFTKNVFYTSLQNQQLYTTPAAITMYTSIQVFRNGISVDFTTANSTQIQITPAVDAGDKIKILQQF